MGVSLRYGPERKSRLREQVNRGESLIRKEGWIREYGSPRYLSHDSRLGDREQTRDRDRSQTRKWKEASSRPRRCDRSNRQRRKDRGKKKRSLRPHECSRSNREEKEVGERSRGRSDIECGFQEQRELILI